MSGVDDKETGSLLWKLEPPLGATEQESNLAFEQQEGNCAGAWDMTGCHSPRALLLRSASRLRDPWAEQEWATKCVSEV